MQYRCGAIVIDATTHRLTRDSQDIEIQPLVFRALLTLIALRTHVKVHWHFQMVRAWYRGRHQAAYLPITRWEELMPLPLEEVRRRLRVVPLMA